MRDEEESGNTPTQNLLGPLKPKAADVAEAEEELDVPPEDATDTEPLLPVAPSTTPPIPPPRPPLHTPPNPWHRPTISFSDSRTEMTVQRARPSAADLRTRLTTKPSATTWGRGLVWMMASGIVGGVAVFAALKLREPKPDEEPPQLDPPAHAAQPAAEQPSPASPPAALPTALVAPATAAPDVPVASAQPPTNMVASAVPLPPAGARAAGRSSQVEALGAAAVARQQGKPEQAKALYQGVLDRNADDLDALMGRAEIARAEGKSSDAKAFYEHALIVSPTHGPAILGLADTLWDMDDKDRARARYRELLKRGAPTTYPARVAERAE
jgi:hypothetical protein